MVLRPQGCPHSQSSLSPSSPPVPRAPSTGSVEQSCHEPCTDSAAAPCASLVLWFLPATQQTAQVTGAALLLRLGSAYRGSLWSRADLNHHFPHPFTGAGVNNRGNAANPCPQHHQRPCSFPATGTAFQAEHPRSSQGGCQTEGAALGLK